MNKLICSIIITLLTVNTLFSQSYMDEITKKTCECAKEKVDMPSYEEMLMEFGVCMIAAAEPYKKQLKKDHKIDMDKLGDSGAGERLGSMIGVKMASYCPDILIKMSHTQAGEIDESEIISIPAESVQGVVIKVEDEPFVVITLKEASGKISKYYWLTFVNIKYGLFEDYKSLINKYLIIEYQQMEFFDPKIQEYRNFSIIDSLELLEM